MRQRANRRIAEAFCGDEARVAAFTSSESFPSTFQIMRERNPSEPEFPLSSPPPSSVPGNPCRYVSCDSPRTRESSLHLSLSLLHLLHLSLSFSPASLLSLSFSPRMSRTARNSYRFTREERRERDPRGRITRYRRSHFRSCATWMHRTRPMIARRLSLFRRRLDISGAMLAAQNVLSGSQLWSRAWANRERKDPFTYRTPVRLSFFLLSVQTPLDSRLVSTFHIHIDFD